VIAAILTDVQRQLQVGPSMVDEALTTLTRYLVALKGQQSSTDWATTIARCRAHPLCDIIHQDPLTARAYAKPRGYSGDAELLDIIYTRDYRSSWRQPVTILGEAIFNHTISCNAPSAVRDRRDFLTSQIDGLCVTNPTAHILSVACGHLREAESSSAVVSGTFGRFVGFDQDQNSLLIATESLGRFGVETVCGSIKTLLTGSLVAERFDFIYAAGLYDYLHDRLARQVTQTLFAMLRHGGRLLLANYLPEIDDAGFMEAYADWKLIYRNADAMRLLAVSIPASTIGIAQVFPDASNTIAYLDLYAR